MSDQSYNFKFERVCFVLAKDEPCYKYVTSKEEPPILHLYEKIQERSYLNARNSWKSTGPFVAELVDRYPESIVYELTDQKFEKEKIRREFYWTLGPSNWVDFCNEGLLNVESRHGPRNDSERPEEGSFNSASQLYPDIDRNLPKGWHLGGHIPDQWGVRLCSRIAFI